MKSIYKAICSTCTSLRRGRACGLGILSLALISSLAAVALAPPAAVSANHRALVGWCNPTNPRHYLTGGHTGYGAGDVVCDTTRGFNWTVRLYNASGSVLAQTSGFDSYQSATFGTSIVGCSGAYIHGYIYVNYNGAGQSNTEQSADLC